MSETKDLEQKPVPRPDPVVNPENENIPQPAESGEGGNEGEEPEEDGDHPKKRPDNP